LDAGTLVFYKNGTSQGTAATGLSGTFTFATGQGGSGVTGTFNFGQRPFAYTAPSGFKALTTQNLPTPTIGATPATQAGKFFNPVLWTGNSVDNRGITGVGFQPDFVWLKARSNAGQSHHFVDAVRGYGTSAMRTLFSNQTSAEESNKTTGTLLYGNIQSLNADGFTVAAGGAYDQVNRSGETYVAWNWKANGAGVTNTAGTITSTVSANTTSGFSVVTYTGNGAAGPSVGHGLGAVPKMIILKQRASATNYNWFVYHQAIGNTQYLLLNSSNPASSGVSAWNNTTPTSSVFTIGSYAEVNNSGSTFVAYCFSEVPGYSKFGSYTGNGSSDGPFVFCGFRPAYVMIKNTTQSGGWMLWDDMRSPTNVADDLLYANLSIAEQVYTGLDLTANGFKIRNTSSDFNWNGDTYIFAAFAEAPQKFALAR
jgi:hypothetical protein